MVGDLLLSLFQETNAGSVGFKAAPRGLRGGVAGRRQALWSSAGCDCHGALVAGSQKRGRWQSAERGWGDGGGELVQGDGCEQTIIIDQREKLSVGRSRCRRARCQYRGLLGMLEGYLLMDKSPVDELFLVDRR